MKEVNLEEILWNSFHDNGIPKPTHTLADVTKKAVKEAMKEAVKQALGLAAENAEIKIECPFCGNDTPSLVNHVCSKCYSTMEEIVDKESILDTIEMLKFDNKNSVQEKHDNKTTYGIYIVLEDGTYISKDEYNNRKCEARGIFIYTEKLCHELSLFDHTQEMTWDESVKHSIPSKDEWEEIANYMGEVEEILKLTGGDTLKYKWYWTSTEFSSNYSWGYYGSYGKLSNRYKYNSCRVRTFKPFKIITL